MPILAIHAHTHTHIHTHTHTPNVRILPVVQFYEKFGKMLQLSTTFFQKKRFFANKRKLFFFKVLFNQYSRNGAGIVRGAGIVQGAGTVKGAGTVQGAGIVQTHKI